MNQTVHVKAQQLKYYTQASLVSASLLLALGGVSLLWVSDNGIWSVAAITVIVLSCLLFARSHILAASLAENIIRPASQIGFARKQRLRVKLDSALHRRKMKALMKLSLEHR